MQRPAGYLGIVLTTDRRCSALDTYLPVGGDVNGGGDTAMGGMEEEEHDKE